MSSAEAFETLTALLAERGVELGVDDSAPDCDPSVLHFTFADGRKFELTAENSHVLFLAELVGPPEEWRPPLA